MKSLSLLIGAALLTAAASFGQTNADSSRVKLYFFSSLPISQNTIAVGGSFSVYLYAFSAGQIVHLYGYQFDLRFDPAKLQAVAVTEGNLFKNTGVSDFIPGLIDNQAGLIRTTFNSLQGQTASVPTGVSTTLATIQFKTLQAGDAEIRVEYPVVVDRTGARAPLTIEPFTIKVR